MRRIWSLRMIITVLGISCSFFFSFLDNSCAFFTNGQDADIVLSASGFNNAGYLNNPGDGLLFNHPGNISTDGTHLLLADTRNNRILIWNSLPTGNVSPDLVLGQDDLTTNNPGTTLSRLNWPVGVSTGGGKVVVSDTYNNRILIWNSFPTSNAQSANLYINNFPFVDPSSGFSGSWPWGIWTNGTKLVVCLTQSHQVWIWKTFPTASNQAPDLILTGKKPTNPTTTSFGTPRSIGTDGSTYLVIGDHNGSNQQTAVSFFWTTFPSTDEPYTFMMDNPAFPGLLMWGGEKTTDGKFVILSPPGISIWNSFPTSATQPPNLFVGRQTLRDVDEGCTNFGFHMNVGDGSHIVLTPTGRVYISLDNGNRVLGYNSLPTSAVKCPDFVIGSPDINTNTYTTSFIDSPLPATDGHQLIVTSGLDFKLHVWQAIPTADNTKPDLSYDLGNLQIMANALYSTTFIAAGYSGTQQQVLVWNSLPPDGNHPDLVFSGAIGSANLQNVQGVALDDKYLYIADMGAGKVHVWNALPSASTSPLFSLNVSQAGKICSDGKYLAVIDGSHWTAKIYLVSTLSSSATPVAELPAPGASYSFAVPGPSTVLIAANHLFLSDDTGGRVLGWRSIENAIAGYNPNVVLGQPDLFQGRTESIAKNRLFWPYGMAFDGTKLWVGEFKFSSRLVGFKVKPDAMPWLLLLLGN